jgi:hypothetical protein
LEKRPNLIDGKKETCRKRRKTSMQKKKEKQHAKRESVVPRPSFEETLVRFGPLLDFDNLVEKGAPRRS